MLNKKKTNIVSTLKANKHLALIYLLINLIFLSFVGKINGQGSSLTPSHKNSISLEMAYYSGYLYFASLQNYDIISNYHRSIYSSEHYRIESKIGIGLRQVFSNTAMTPIQLNLLNYFGKRNHKPVAGIGIFTGSEIGFHIPIILGYEYSFCEWFGIQACIEPVVWYGYYSFNGFNNDDWIEKWIWEKNSDNSVLFTLGIMTKF